MVDRITQSEFRQMRSSASGTSLREIAGAALSKSGGENAQPAPSNARKIASPKPPTEHEEQGRPNKYKAKKVVTEEGVFDSKMEYKRWCELRTMERARLITNLERQIEYTLEVNGVKIGKFTADHRWEANGKVWVEDVKGVIVRDFTLRKKLMLAIYGIDVMVWPERKKKKRKMIKR